MEIEDLLARCAHDIPRYQLPDALFAHISPVDSPSGVIAIIDLPPEPDPARLADGAALSAHSLVVLDGVQDPGNLGTILRSLAWFGGFRCLLSPGSVDPFNLKVVRASMGAIFHTPIEQDVSLDNLSTRFARIACLDMQGQSLRAPAFAQAECYLFGNEARGVPSQALSELNATPFTIAGSGAIESLNLASTVNICVYELSR